MHGIPHQSARPIFTLEALDPRRLLSVDLPVDSEGFAEEDYLSFTSFIVEEGGEEAAVRTFDDAVEYNGEEIFMMTGGEVLECEILECEILTVAEEGAQVEEIPSEEVYLTMVPEGLEYEIFMFEADGGETPQDWVLRNLDGEGEDLGDIAENELVDPIGGSEIWEVQILTLGGDEGAETSAPQLPPPPSLFAGSTGASGYLAELIGSSKKSLIASDDDVLV